MRRYLILALTLMSIGTAAAVPPLIPASEQRIASMEINKSAGNMTGDDYLVALVFAYINDSINYDGESSYKTEYMGLFEEAHKKIPEYSFMGSNIQIELAHILGKMMAESQPQTEPSSYTMPLQGYIDRAIDEIFTDPELADYLVTKRAEVNSRLAEDAKQRELQGELQAAQEAAKREEKAKQEAFEQEEKLRKQAEEQEKMKYQIALDAQYKNISENYTSNLTILLNQSKFTDALNLSDEAIKDLVSPYSNKMIINKGDVYSSMGRYEDAISTYKNAQKEFAYINDSSDYQSKVQQDFERDWNTIVLYKINLAMQKLDDQITAKKHDLRNAPSVKQLLSGHDSGREYSIDVENLTYIGKGYVVSINLSAINLPIDQTNETDVYIKTKEDTNAFVPLCIDMFGSLFADNRVAYVCIQNNETYIDRFANKKEVPVWLACMDNGTAEKIGNWEDFKQYVGMDMDKLSSVASVKELEYSEK